MPLVSRRAFLRRAAGLAGLTALALTGCVTGSNTAPATVVTSTDAFQETDLLVSVDWLAERLRGSVA